MVSESLIWYMVLAMQFGLVAVDGTPAVFARLIRSQP